MRKFPRREAEVAALAQLIVAGLKKNADDFVSPPLSPAELQALLDDYRKKHNAAVSAQAAAGLAFDAKDKALKELTEGMKVELHYAEYATKHDEDKLRSLGWRKRREPRPVRAPGQTLPLEVRREGPGWICLDWKRPRDGGKVATYQVQVRYGDNREWQNVELCFETLTVLTEQKRGVDLNYRVFAFNKAGEGLPSNTVTAVL